MTSNVPHNGHSRTAPSTLMQIATILLLYHKKFYKPDISQTRICISFPDIENTTFFTESICKGSESISTTHAERGIIISHSTIPWNYDNELLKGRFHTKQKMVCKKVLHVRPHIEEKYLLTIDLFDIDEDSDTLFINDEKVVDKQFRKISNSDDIISITFTTNVRWSKGGSGFVICYKSKSFNLD